MLVLWPVSTSFGPLVAFVIINGAANGGFFACMPTVVANVFGAARVSVAMGMVVSGWVGGYLLVGYFILQPECYQLWVPRFNIITCRELQ